MSKTPGSRVRTLGVPQGSRRGGGRGVRAIVRYRGLPSSDPDSLVDVRFPTPVAEGRDVLIEVQAVSVSPVDVRARAFRSATPQGLVLGVEGTGTVVEAGPDVTRFAPGDQVWWAGDAARPGSNAEYQLVDERNVALKPLTASWEEVAAMPLAAITAWELLFDRLRLTEDSTETILMVGAQGAVGSLLLQLSRARLPLITTVATAASDRDAARARSLGADAIIDVRQDILEQVDSAAPHGVDWIVTPNSRGVHDIGSTVFRPFGNGIIRRDGGLNGAGGGDAARGVASHWDLVYTRALDRIPASVDRHDILDQVAGMVDLGELRTAQAPRLLGLDARTMRRAHAFVESETTTGTVVVTR